MMLGKDKDKPPMVNGKKQKTKTYISPACSRPPIYDDIAVRQRYPKWGKKIRNILTNNRRGEKDVKIIAAAKPPS